MKSLYFISRNTFLELVRQPVFLILMAGSMVFSVVIASMPYFGFGGEPKLVRESVLAVLLMSGLAGAILSASSSVGKEIRSGTAHAVLSKPVGRVEFLLAKFAGVAAILTLFTYMGTLAALLSSRLAYDAYGSANFSILGIFLGSMVLAMAIAGVSNYFFRRHFVIDAVIALACCATLAFLLINFMGERGSPHAFETGTDWRMLLAATLILFQLWILGGIAIACSLRFELVPGLLICASVFLLGLVSDYVFGNAAEKGHVWGNLLYAMVPNVQLFWVVDALEGAGGIPWSYVARALFYTLFYLGAMFALSIVLFEDRELV